MSEVRTTKGTCVACGAPLGGIQRGEEFFQDHHCDERKLKLRNTIMQRGRVKTGGPTWAQRLDYGMTLLR